MSKRQRDNTIDGKSNKPNFTNYAVFTHKVFECTKTTEGYTKGGSPFISFCRTKPQHSYNLIGICATSNDVSDLINTYLVNNKSKELAYEIYDDTTKFDQTHDCTKKLYTEMRYVNPGKRNVGPLTTIVSKYCCDKPKQCFLVKEISINEPFYFF